MPSASVGAVRLATFNLLHGQSLAHGGVHESELRAAVAELDADIVGLQEVDRGQARSGLVDQAAVVASELGAADWRFVPAVDGTPGESWTTSTADDGAKSEGPAYGVALVSRLPVRSWAVRRFNAAPVSMPLMVAGSKGLTPVDDEPRVGVAAVIDAPSGVFTVVNAHLSFVPGWNAAQLRALTRWMEPMPGPRLILGDLNLPGVLPRVATGWTQLARVATYPSYKPRVQLDHVLADRIAPSRVRDARAVRLAVSDHCALVVDLDL